MTKTILIIGGTQNIGLSLAKIYIKKGYNVICSGRKKNDVIKIGAKFENVDMQNIESIHNFCQNLKSYPTFDIVIMNAGIYSPLKKILPNGFDDMIMVNFLAHVIIIDNIVNSIVGSIVFISSPASINDSFNTNIINNVHLSSNQHKSYGSTKLLLNILCNMLYTKFGIQTLSISPGKYVDTQMLQQSLLQKIYHTFTNKLTPECSATNIVNTIQNYSDGQHWGKYIGHDGNVVLVTDIVSASEIDYVENWINSHIKINSNYVFKFDVLKNTTNETNNMYVIFVIILALFFVIINYNKISSKNL